MSYGQKSVNTDSLSQKIPYLSFSLILSCAGVLLVLGIAVGIYDSCKNHIVSVQPNDYPSRAHQDIKKSQDYLNLEKEAEAGDVEAELKMAELNDTFNNVSFDHDYKISLKWYEKAANQGNDKAEFYLGQLYFQGHGVFQNYMTAKYWWEKSAMHGNVAAMRHLGDMYFYGEGVQADNQQAMIWYQKAIDKKDPVTESWVAEIYEKGMHNIAQDYHRALSLYQLAAEEGNQQAQFELGNMYYHGLGVEKNIEKARQWLEDSASSDQDGVAQTVLGDIYFKGEGVVRDYANARYWFEKGAQHGEPESLIRLGQIYENGLGVPKDMDKAHLYYEDVSDLDEESDYGYINYAWGVLALRGWADNDIDIIHQALIYFDKACEQGETLGCDAFKKVSGHDGEDELK